ncbi:phage terminase small subunit [Vibrio ostreicida]|uniref:phage terminase small subunit n=1 Tax=Vibrio ostreicida TaxID=526588 RepID=UPI000970B09C|nr:phage terminase small subunit [Vibrio ostreicida]
MLSILIKRKHQLQPKPRQPEQIKQPEASASTRPAFAKKPWEETQAALKNDLGFLKSLSGSKEKDPYKEELVKKYRPLVEKLLETHKGNYANLAVMWWFYLWQVDLGRMEEVYGDFRFAVESGLEPPTTWRTNGHTAFCDLVFNYSHQAVQKKKAFKREYLINAVKDLRSGQLATNAPLKVKMYRLVGDWHFEAGEKKEAHDLFEQVMKLDPNKGGRKTKLKDLREELGYDSPN